MVGVALMKRRLDYLQQEAGIENGTSCSAIPENCDCCHENENDDSNGNVDDTQVVNNYPCQFPWVPPSSYFDWGPNDYYNDDSNGKHFVKNYRCQFPWVPPSSSHILTEPSLQGRLHHNIEAGRKDVVVGGHPY